MIDVKQAVKIARDYLIGLYEEELPNLMLEEVDHSEGYWLITFGFDAKEKERGVRSFGDLQQIYDYPAYRNFKLITVHDEDGAVVSMRIRKV
jgi:hypothetical protein